MRVPLDLASLAGLNLDLDQYVGLWAIDEAAGMQLYDRVGGMNLVAHCTEQLAAGRDVAAASMRPQAHDELSIAVIDIQGTMTKRGSSLSRAGSTVMVRRTLREAARDKAVDGILLRIDSPGGTVAGTADLAAEVAEANRRKPVYAYAEDTAASAAYWVASQAAKIFANNGTAKIGSIGTLLFLYDLSGAADKEGIRPVVIKTGDLKGVGVPGTPVTAEQEAYLQEIVDQTQVEFSAGVAAGRGLTTERVAAVATGRVYSAGEARKLGLIDGIESFESTLGLLAEAIRSRRPHPTGKRGSGMSTEHDRTLSLASAAPIAPQPAAYQDLKAAFPSAPADFLTSQLDANATLDQARAAWQRNLEERATAAEARAKDLEAKAAEAAKAAKNAAKGKGIGVEALRDGTPAGQGGTEPSDATGQFEAAVELAMAAGKPRHKAIRDVGRKHPELRAAWVEEANAAR